MDGKLIGKDYHRLGFDKGFKNVGTMAPLMGGHPVECPERYTLFSPLTHIHPNCPPTLLIHGAHDIMAPVATLYMPVWQKKKLLQSCIFYHRQMMVLTWWYGNLHRLHIMPFTMWNAFWP